MKSLKIIMAACVLALTGCFAEDYELCPPETNVELAFRLPNDDMEDMFGDHIFATTTAVYDAEGKFVEAFVTTEKHHAEFQGVKMYLEEGTYHVVSWGNMGTNTIDHNMGFQNRHPESFVGYQNIDEDRKVGHGDALYYAPNTVDMGRTRAGNEEGEYVMTVGRDGHTGTLDFRHAHRRVEIYVKGFESQNDKSVGNPTVQMTGLPHGLTVTGMRRVEDVETVNAEFRSEIVTAPENQTGRFALAAFNAFYFHADDYEIDINIIDPLTGTMVYTEALIDAIRRSDPEWTDDPENEITITLLIEFKSTGVVVTIPDWKSTGVDYGIFD